MSIKMLTLLGLTLSGILIYFCINNKKDAIFAKYNTSSKEIVAQQIVVEKVARKEENATVTTTLPTTEPIQKMPSFVYQAGELDKIIGVFATQDHESSLAKMLNDNCTEKTCNKDIQYVDDVSSCEVEKEIVKLISYSKQEKINDFALKLHEKVVTVEGTLKTQEQANVVKLYLEYLTNKGHTVVNKIQSDNLAPFVQEVEVGQENKKKTEDNNTLSTIEQSNTKIHTILSNDPITFEKERSAISKKSKRSLDGVINIISELNNIMIEVAGYTDSKGGETYNKVLSQKRADAVRLYLIKSGTDEKIVKSIGYGEINFISDPENSINRRVEIHLKRRKMK